MKIVIFDTGTGGRLYSAYLHRHLKNTDITTIIDAANAPYGQKSPIQIKFLTTKALKIYLGTKAIIVLACNTATAYAIESLRKKYPNQTFIGFEPTIKPAMSVTKTGKILVIATPATLKSPRYNKLKSVYTANQNPACTIYEADCSAWARLIDTGKMTTTVLKSTLQPYHKLHIDTIVLACTHFIAVKPQLKALFPTAQLIDPFLAVTKYLKTLLNQ
jgi:glutamate racemase